MTNQEDRDYKDVIAFRSFKIMETVFLLSELQGSFVKPFDEDIDAEKFDSYFNQNFPLFKKVILNFS